MCLSMLYMYSYIHVDACMCIQGYLSVPSIAAVRESDDPEEEALKVYLHVYMEICV